MITSAAAYLTWFHPGGAMNRLTSSQALSPKVPVLFIVPAADHPGLLRAKRPMFDALPKHPHSKLSEPDSNHLRAPSASREEIARWIAEVASR